MVDYVWPSHIPVAEVEWRLVDLTSRQDSPYSGTVRTVSRGQRLACTFRLQNLTAADRAYVLGLVAALRGGANRIWLYDPANRQRGSFPGGELLSNSTFTNGTTGWTLDGGSFAVADRVMRSKSVSSASWGFRQTPVVTQFAPHAGRALIVAGRNSSASLRLLYQDNAAGGPTADTLVPGGGLATSAIVNSTATGLFEPYDSATNHLAGDFFSVPYATVQRCALADGAPNLLTYSSTLSNAAWSKATGTGAGDNGTAAPDGTLTDQYIQETDAVSREHYVIQGMTVASSAQDFTISCYAIYNARNFLLLRFSENTGNTYCYAWFNVNTGVLGTVSASGNWSNPRATITAVGGGWYRCTLTARKTNAATSISAFLQTAASDNSTSYAGVASTIALRVWRASVAASSVPVRDSVTTTTAAAAVTQSGTVLFVKGLPASTNGLLLPGDGVEIQGERKIVTASLDSDAAGLGYLQFEPAMRVAAADNAPVIIGQPLFKALLAEDAAWTTRPGIFSDLDLTFVEA